MTTAEREVLTLIADGRDGIAAALSGAHGVRGDLVATLIGAGLAVEMIERAKAGTRSIEITRVKITDAGKRALAGT